jgi:regulator of replication initiation timing
MTMPDDDLKIDVQDLLNAQSNISAQQIAALMRRNAELEALNAALRRALAAQAEENTPHRKPRAVGDG